MSPKMPYIGGNPHPRCQWNNKQVHFFMKGPRPKPSRTPLLVGRGGAPKPYIPWRAPTPDLSGAMDSSLPEYFVQASSFQTTGAWVILGSPCSRWLWHGYCSQRFLWWLYLLPWNIPTGCFKYKVSLDGMPPTSVTEINKLVVFFLKLWGIQWEKGLEFSLWR